MVTSGNRLSSTVISGWSSAAGTAVFYQHLEARNAYVQRENIKKDCSERSREMSYAV